MNERQKLIADVKQQYAELYKTVHNMIFHIEEDETSDLLRLALAEEEHLCEVLASLEKITSLNQVTNQNLIL